MFKKTALAAAVALVTGPVVAASWEVAHPVHTPVTHTLQGVTGTSEATGAVNTNAVVTLGAEYALNDTITFTNSVAKATGANWPTSLDTQAKSTTAVVTTDGSTYAAGVTTTIAAANHNMSVGDRFTITNDSTNTQYTAITGTTGKILNFAPKMAESMASGEDITEVTNSLTLGLVSSDATSAVYRVSTVNNAGSQVGMRLVSPNMALSSAGLVAAGTNTTTFTAATGSGLAMDAGAGALTTAKTTEEYSLTVGTKFDGIVDVEADRKSFTVSSGTNKTGDAVLTTRDALGYVLTNSVGTDGTKTTTGKTTGAVSAVSATETASVMTLAADWSFLDKATTAGTQINITATAGVANAIGTASSSAVGTAAVNTSGDLTVTFTSANGGTDKWGANAASTLIVTSDQSAAIPVQNYTASHKMTYNNAAVTGGTKTLTAAAGGWTLNGASVTAYGVPWSAATQKFLWVGNTGATDAVMEASVEYGGVTYGPYAVGTVGLKSQKKVSDALDAALVTAGVDTSAWSRANVTVTSSVKAASITMNASYKHIADADRLSVPTSDDIDGTTK